MTVIYWVIAVALLAVLIACVLGATPASRRAADRPGTSCCSTCDRKSVTMTSSTVLWVIAEILVIAGIVTLIRGAVLLGIVLIVAGLS